MRMKTLFAAGVLSLLPSIAMAHPGGEHTHSLLAGLAHPMTGLDHLLAMLAVGMWAAQKGGRALWAWPLSFLGFMLLGAMLGIQGVGLPLVEPMIAASIMVLGLIIASMTTLPLGAGALLIATFAMFHGNAHGLEAPLSGEAALYALGFVLTTAMLHALGVALGFFARGAAFDKLLRAGGALMACVGGVFLFV